MADEPAADADVRQQLQAVADLPVADAAERKEQETVGAVVGAVGDLRAVGVNVGKATEDVLNLFVDRRDKKIGRLQAGLVGREGGGGGVGAQRGVHARGDGAEPVQ